MKNKLGKKWSSYGAASIIVAFIVVFISVNFIYIYESNDDYFIATILNGTYTGRPSAYTIYVLYPLSFLMKKFYDCFPNINWYGYCIVGLHYIGIFLIYERLFEIFYKKKKQMFFLLLGMIGFICIDFKFIINPQYTVTAGVLAAAAVFLLATTENKNSVREYIIPAILLLLVLNLRRDVFWIALPFAVFAVMMNNLSCHMEENRRERFKKQVIFGFVFTAIAGTMLLIHFFSYNTDEWAEYIAFNEARTTVYDYNMLPNYADNLEFYDSIGIKNENEMHLLQSQNTTFRSTIDNDMMTKIAIKTEEIKDTNEQFYNVPIDVAAKYFAWMTSGGIIIGTSYLLLFLIFCLSIMCGDYRYIVEAFIAEALRVGMVCYLIYKGRYIERATYPINLLLLAVLVAILLANVSAERLKERKLSKKQAWMKRVAYVVAFGMILFVCAMVYRENLHENRNIVDSRYWQPTVTKYFAEKPSNIYFMGVMGTGQLRSPVFGTEQDLSFNRIDMGGWRSKSPVEREMLTEKKIENIEEDLITNENVYWVQIDEYPIEWLKILLEEHGERIDIELYDSIYMQGQIEYNVYKVKKVVDF